MAFFRTVLGPLCLILLCPLFVILLWYTNTALDGSFYNLFALFQSKGIPTTLYSIWHPIFFGNIESWAMLITFVLVELFLLLWLPAKQVSGPITEKGNIPVYKDNGLLAFIITMTSFYLCTFQFKLFSPTIIYDNLGPLFSILSLSSLVICFLLYLKGRYSPSSSDSSVSGNFIFDYYWGTELYPTIKNVNLKMFINCRLGMMSWGLFLFSYLAKQQQLFGLSNALFISVALQFIYLTKFYIWESGYLRSLDIMHDRAGFYICWGCLVWVPCVYTSPAMYLVLHPINLSPIMASFFFLAGTVCILMNYQADRQRQLVRATQGNCLVWGKQPVIKRVVYLNHQNEQTESILLASGWWGIARHFHYVTEIGAAFFWSVPALFYNFSPYFYVSFLTILLVDRVFRDDKRCLQKYGDGWKSYCELVPYKMIPYLL